MAMLARKQRKCSVNASQKVSFSVLKSRNDAARISEKVKICVRFPRLTMGNVISDFDRCRMAEKTKHKTVEIKQAGSRISR